MFNCGERQHFFKNLFQNAKRWSGMRYLKPAPAHDSITEKQIVLRVSRPVFVNS